MTTRARTSISGGVFALTVFTSAFLLFQVQPLLARFILPWFGGTPSVWTACMLVFQLLLFAGYLWAHLLTKIRRISRQVAVHGVLIAAATLTLPITPAGHWKPQGDESPGTQITLLLLCSVGLPYFVLSATGPLLQHWFGRISSGTASPYRLYAVSNIGSLLALLSYPFLIEPHFPSTIQAGHWSILFVLFAMLCLSTGWIAAVRTPHSDASNLSSAEPVSISAVSVSRWFVLAMIPSILLLGTTNEVCMDIAVVPFLWIVPLTLYLLSFIITFESDRFYSRRIVVPLSVCSLTAALMLPGHGDSLNVLIQIPVHFAALFSACLLCHGELVQRRPDTNGLTTFYLTIAAGGAAGGLFTGLIAPLIFSAYWELPLGILATLMICAGTWVRQDQTFDRKIPASTSLAVGGGISAALLGVFVFVPLHSAGTVTMQRNFYGVLRIEDLVHEGDGRPVRDMVHGRVVHGRQYLDESGQNETSTYYSPSSGVGKLLGATPERFAAGSGRRVGIVGLGAGTLAAYGRPADTFRFYEINPAVIRMAERNFSFLRDSSCAIEILPGDARLVLEREADQRYDALVLDAFSGDAIPVHLLTAEAVRVYSRHLRPDGVLAVHISNQYFDLEPVVRALGESVGLNAQVCRCPEGADQGRAFDSVWMLLCRNAETLTAVLGTDESGQTFRTVLWTDDRNNLLNVLR